MSKQKLTVDDVEQMFHVLRDCVTEYDAINFVSLLDLETSARRINDLAKKFSTNLSKCLGKQGEVYLRKRISSSFIQHQIDELDKMYEVINCLKKRMEILEEKFNKVRKDLQRGLTAEGYCGCERYLNCFKQGINKAKFFLSKLEILVGASHKVGNQFPLTAIWFKSMEGYIIGTMIEKDLSYTSTYIPPELFQQV